MQKAATGYPVAAFCMSGKTLQVEARLQTC